MKDFIFMKDEKIKKLLNASKNNGPIRVGFFLIPNFSMLAFASAIEPLRAANRISEKELFSWYVSSKDGNSVKASNEIIVNTDGEHNKLFECKLVFVISGIDIKEHTDVYSLNIFRKLDRHGVIIGGINTGTYLLAKSGLLNYKRCTIHWENNYGLVEEFPMIEVTNELFEIDDMIITCSGGTASIDLILYIVTVIYGNKLATEISDQMIHDRIRESTDKQRMRLRSRLGISHPKLLSAVNLMENTIEEPLSQIEISKSAKLSNRQLERLFKKYLNSTPTKYYLNLRLAKARDLIRQTSMSILSVALACGFVSSSHFSKCYKEYFNKSPREERLVNQYLISAKSA